MSSDYVLITRRRPDAWAFARTLSETAGRTIDIDGNFDDPDDYLNISAGEELWIEVEPPGHVEHQDLLGMYPEEFLVLPEPDDEGCLWFATASVPAAYPGGGNVILETFRRLAQEHEGIATPAP